MLGSTKLSKREIVLPTNQLQCELFNKNNIDKWQGQSKHCSQIKNKCLISGIKYETLQ